MSSNHSSAQAGPEEGVVRSTVRGLLAPRRALPIALVVVPLTIIQDAYSRDAFAVPLALLLCGSFLLVGPSLWRALFPMERGPRKRSLEAAPRPARPNPLARVLVYGFVGAALVLGIGEFLPKLIGAGRTFLTSGPSLVVCVALFWVGGWGLARDIDLEEHLRRERARSEALEREAEHAQLLALKTHLDPHFLFNTLNAIAEWCREDGAVAEKAIVQLSSMLRTMMTGITETSWALEKELELAFALFELHAVRDPSFFTVVRDVPSPLPHVLVPPMLLLPLAENAMKHGPLARRRGEVVVRVEVVRGLVRIEIGNPGKFMGDRPGGSGLPIVRKRLGLAYGHDASFSIEADGERTRALVVVPISPFVPESLARASTIVVADGATKPL
ncbi:Autolysin sensor kinase [Labilithrix luteola]|uniref:Autolysin sensor kinase n=1 Tax=Labilithrix luteola TaxID=1391654 RepID=A0A0K1Q015_9BACT|nr:histidine kinase [Labilithrix luteola]AKU98981.1 Autolysin sensor kinase [Labilithrix luteola]